MTEKIFENIYRIDVPLPDSPLKNLNAYLIRGERNLLIDTGFNLELCYNTLINGMYELGARPENTDIFLTHLHADHSGLAYRLQRKDTKVFISEEDTEYLMVSSREPQWKVWDDFYIKEGFPRAELDVMPSKNAARVFAPSKDCKVTTVYDGDTLHYGGHELLCVSAKGHTPGLMCLYIAAEKTMFLSDHVLFDITPNITVWPNMQNSLSVYIKSLERFSIKNYDVERPLPSHRGVGGKSLKGRIAELEQHHRLRLKEVLDIVRSRDGLTAFEIAAQMTWSIRAKNWDAFPSAQKWFATGEALAHLRWLQDEGALSQAEENGLYRYYKTPPSNASLTANEDIKKFW